MGNNLQECGMRLGAIQQQPGERLSYTINYTDALTEGDNVLSATATVAPTDELVVDQVSAIDPLVRFWATGGVSGKRYTVTVQTTTADGRIFEDELIFVIREI